MKKKQKINSEISSTPVHGDPQDAFELINKYGTYNIQPTGDTVNDYPKISQGLSKKEAQNGRKKDFGEK